ncbi:hypothetical protein A8C56_14305 [Niabella ginsenosidivorans]|uniref:UspA domain-containing protein n=1 Tax=Niabella ginsenosidivorans TaxID=1176587 RepID=A0A1A9I2Z0_9BACT|nr:universal stress protein [Niabella ginsenosidivorans]ANH81986.1 hypothetical protein A8C56_14305 [Niabella ginsenosidivorans]
MRTILVPVDATSTSENAVKFAAEWGIQYGYDHIVLLKTSYESMFDYVTIADGYAFVNEESVNSQQENTEILLEHLRSLIVEKAPDMKVTTTVSGLSLLRSTIDLVKNDATVELIVLGSDDKAVSNNSVVSANIIGIARTSPVKTLIVPSGYDYKPVKKVLIPCDVSRITNLDRLSRFRSILKQEDARLVILNVNTKGDTEVTDSKKKEWEEHIQQYLTDIPYSVYYSFDRNIIKGILSFTASNKADLIIALPGKHSFLYYLANRSISEGIYQNVHQVVLILK